MTDPGTELLNVDVTSLCTWLGIKRRLSVAKRPQGHGTEPSVGRAKRHLAILASTERMRHDWADPTITAAAELILNANTHEEVGEVPLVLKYGSITAATMAKLLDNGRMQSTQHATNLVLTLNKNLKELQKASAEHQEQVKRSRRANSNNSKEEHRYQAGDYIMWKSEAPFRIGGPLAARLLGPYEVVSQNNAVVVAKHMGTGKSHKLHHDRTTILTVNKEIAQELAAHSASEHTIVNVVDHRGSLEGPRSALTFLTCFADGETQWLTYEEVHELEALDTYAKTLACTRLLLLGTKQDVVARKKVYSAMSINELTAAGLLPTLTINAEAYVSTHAPPVQARISSTYPEIITPQTEAFVPARITRISDHSADLHITSLNVTVEWAAWRLAAYVVTAPLTDLQEIIEPTDAKEPSKATSKEIQARKTHAAHKDVPAAARPETLPAQQEPTQSREATSAGRDKRTDERSTIKEIERRARANPGEQRRTRSAPAQPNNPGLATSPQP